MATPATGPVNQPTVSFGPNYPAPGSLEGAGFGLRVLARVLDYAVLYFAIFVASLFSGIMIGIFASLTGRPLPSNLGEVGWQYYAATFIGFFLYHWICEGAHGSTLGKLICGLVVISEDGNPCGMKAAAGRSLAYYIDGLVFGLVAYFSMKESPKRQRLGDKWNDTMVVRRADVAPQVLRSSGRFLLVFLTAIFLQAVIVAFAILMKLVS